MLKYKPYEKGRVTFGFGCDPRYPANSNCHTGIDTVKGYAAPYHFDNDGEIYKVYRPQEREDNWVGVYQLCDADPRLKAYFPAADYLEVIYGHFMRVPDAIEPGVKVFEGELAGNEGNFGEVYAGGRRITPEEQDRGVIAGHHCHINYRPIVLTKQYDNTKLYLTDNFGSLLRDDGYYYQHLLDDSPGHPRGSINPMLLEQIIDPNDARLRSLVALLRKIGVLT